MKRSGALRDWEREYTYGPFEWLPCILPILAIHCAFLSCLFSMPGSASGLFFSLLRHSQGAPTTPFPLLQLRLRRLVRFFRRLSHGRFLPQRLPRARAVRGRDLRLRNGLLARGVDPVQNGLACWRVLMVTSTVSVRRQSLLPSLHLSLPRPCIRHCSVPPRHQGNGLFFHEGRQWRFGDIGRGGTRAPGVPLRPRPILQRSTWNSLQGRDGAALAWGRIGRGAACERWLASLTEEFLSRPSDLAAESDFNSQSPTPLRPL